MDRDGRMTGPEHYRAAEALLQMLERKAGRPNAQVPRGDIDTTCAWAQVHATLAAAAAAAQNIRRNGAVESEPDGWSEVLS